MPHQGSPGPGNLARDTTARILTARCPLCGALGGLGLAGVCDHSPSPMGTVSIGAREPVHWDRVAAAMAIGAVTSGEVKARFETGEDHERVDVITDVIREIQEGLTVTTTEFSPYCGDTAHGEWVRGKVREEFGEEEVRQIAYDARTRYAERASEGKETSTCLRIMISGRRSPASSAGACST